MKKYILFLFIITVSIIINIGCRKGVILVYYDEDHVIGRYNIKNPSIMRAFVV